MRKPERISSAGLRGLRAGWVPPTGIGRTSDVP